MTTSQLVGANSLVGAMFYGSDGRLNWRAALVFGSAGLPGTFSGMRLSRRLSSSKLQKASAIFVIGLAIFLLIDNIARLF